VNAAVDNFVVEFASAAERQRRLDALRRAMDEARFDALVVAGRGDARLRGRTFYLSDIHEISGDTFVVVSATGDLTFITSPVVGLARASLTTWIQDQRMSATPGAEAARVIAEHGVSTGTIGVVGLNDAISVGHLEELRRGIPRASLIDATTVFEQVRRAKSDEEVRNLRETSDAFRRLFADLEPSIKPGLNEGDLLAEATYLARKYGCKDVKAAFSKTPFVAVTYGSNREISADDILMIWIESPGDSGYWLELRRCYSFGAPPDDVRRYWDLQVEAATAATGAMKPGTRVADVVAIVDGIVRTQGFECRSSNSTYSLHGIGTDAIEGFVYPDDNVELLENEVVSYHPAIHFPDEEQARRLRFVGITDNVLVTSGGGERLTYTSDVFVEL
jgi:Xaa-Pro aminopeptidase